MLNKRLLTRSLIFALPIAVVAGCQTAPTESQSMSMSAADATAADAKKIAEGAMMAIRDLRMEIGEAKRASMQAAEAANRAATAAERAAAEAKAAADKADRVFQRQMRK